MLNINEIKELIKVVDETSVNEVKIELEAVKLTIKKDRLPLKETPLNLVAARQQLPELAQGTTAKAEVEVQEAGVENNAAPSKGSSLTITSPMVGTFYVAPAPDAEPYIKVGDIVSPTSIVCIIEAMKLMNEIEAEVEGEIVEVVARNGELVEYGQPLFIVQPK